MWTKDDRELMDIIARADEADQPWTSEDERRANQDPLDREAEDRRERLGMKGAVKREVDYAKTEAAGRRGHLVFECPRCGSEYTSARQHYSILPSWLSDLVEPGWDWVREEFLQPVLGLRYMGATDRATEDEAHIYEMYARNRRSFESVRSKFVKCDQCGHWACVKCIQGGACSRCRGEKDDGAAIRKMI